MFVGVIVIQLWLYQVSVPAAAAWGLLVPALVLHMYFWMAPLIRERRRQDRDEIQGSTSRFSKRDQPSAAAR